MENVKKEVPSHSAGIFSQDSAFLQQYQAGMLKKNSKPTQQISLLTGKIGSSFPPSGNVEKNVIQTPVIAARTTPTTLLKKKSTKKQKLSEHPTQIGNNGSSAVPTGLSTHPTQKTLTSLIPGGSTRLNPIPGRILTRPILTSQNIYFRKWKRLKKVIKDLMFINAAVCDEVIRVEEKVARVKEERRFLLRKVLHYQSSSDGLSLPSKSSPGGSASKHSGLSSGEGSDTVSKVKSKPKKKVTSVDKKKAATTKELLENMQVKPKKSKSQITKKLIPPLQLDSTGRPVFPLVLGELTIHSIGEIVTDRSGFHTPRNIYPEGFCSTRVFASTCGIDKKCLYTCKISDGGRGPVFEIAAEDNPDLVLRSNSPTDCHNLLITAINKSRGMNILDLIGEGADFFGLSHPVVQNLIQSCPGSKRCAGYKWVKFEISKSEVAETMATESSQDPTISFEAFKILESKGGNKIPGLLEPSTSLRSLLTSKPGVLKAGTV